MINPKLLVKPVFCLVNNGYNWLLKPLPRALYLLELLGTPLEEGHIQIQSDFLMEVRVYNRGEVLLSFLRALSPNHLCHILNVGRFSLGNQL